MTKFSSDQDPDYRNVLSELQRFVRFYEQQTNKELPLATSESPGIQGRSDQGVGNKSSSADQRNANIVGEEDKAHEPTKSFNAFSGTFHSNGGKMIQGNKFNSGGGPMAF